MAVEFGEYKDLIYSVHAPRLLELDRPLHFLNRLHLSLYVYP